MTEQNGTKAFSSYAAVLPSRSQAVWNDRFPFTETKLKHVERQ